MTAAEVLRRAEQRRQWSRALSAIITFLVVGGALYGVAGLIHRRGVAEGRVLEKQATFEQATKDNAEKLRLALGHRDSTKKVAAAAVTRSDVHRDTSASTIGHVKPVAETAIQIDSLPPIVLPKVAVDAYRDLLEGRARDSTTIAGLAADNASLEVENLILNDRVDIFEKHEKDHDAELTVANHRGFWRGVKVGAATIVVVGTAIIIL